MATKHKTRYPQILYKARPEDYLVKDHLCGVIKSMPLEDLKKLFKIEIITQDHCFQMANEAALSYKDSEAQFWMFKAKSLSERDECEVHSEYAY